MCETISNTVMYMLDVVMPNFSGCSSRSLFPLSRGFLHLSVCTGASQLEPTFRLRTFDTNGYQVSIIRKQGAHGLDKRHPWQVAGQVLPLPRWSTLFSSCEPTRGVGLCKRKKKKTLWTCVFALVLGFCVMNGICGS